MVKKGLKLGLSRILHKKNPAHTNIGKYSNKFLLKKEAKENDTQL